MDNFKHYSEKLEYHKNRYQEAVLSGNFAKVNEIVRDATFVCNKLNKNVVVELSEPPELRNFNHAIIIVEEPKQKKHEREKKTENQLMKNAVNDIILIHPAIKKKLCLNGCGNESEKDFCGKRCSNNYKVKKFRQKKDEKPVIV